MYPYRRLQRNHDGGYNGDRRSGRYDDRHQPRTASRPERYNHYLPASRNGRALSGDRRGNGFESNHSSHPARPSYSDYDDGRYYEYDYNDNDYAYHQDSRGQHRPHHRDYSPRRHHHQHRSPPFNRFHPATLAHVVEVPARSLAVISSAGTPTVPQQHPKLLRSSNVDLATTTGTQPITKALVDSNVESAAISKEGVMPVSLIVDLASSTLDKKVGATKSSSLLLSNVDSAATARRSIGASLLQLSGIRRKRKIREVIEVDSTDSGDDSDSMPTIPRKQSSVIDDDPIWKPPIRRKRKPMIDDVATTMSAKAQKTSVFLPSAFGESPFNPLADSGVETNDDTEDDCSDDESLGGHDEGWLSASKQKQVDHQVASSIDARMDKTKLTFEDIPILFQGPAEATNVDRFFVVERRTEALSPNDETTNGNTDDIEGFEVWKRGDYACGMRSSLDRCPHYDTNRSGYSALKRTAKRRKLPIKFMGQGTHVDMNGIHRSYLSNEDKYRKEIDDLQFELLFEDMALRDHPTDTTKMRIASRNKRGNRGASLGFTSGHSTKRDAVTGISEPTIGEDTWRYVPVALKFSRLQEKMALDSGFNLFDDSPQFLDRLTDWAHRIDEKMINELFSLLFLVHDNPQSPAFMDWLTKHSDQQNCPYWSILSFSWKTFFNKRIGRYVTAVMTANWKKSVSDVYIRHDIIGSAADYIVQKYNSTDDYLKTVTVDTLCPDDSILAYRELPIHRDPFVHLSPVLYAIVRLRKYLFEDLGIVMSEYLRDEMIVSAFLESNNMFRFAKFSKEHYERWRSMKMDPLPIGSTFVDCFQIWLRTNYESNEGNHLRTQEKEGCVRYVCSQGTPTLLSTSYNNVKVFHSVMKSLVRKPVTELDYRRTLSRLDKSMEGVGCLKIQKMIYVRTVMGGDLSMSWLNYCLPGSPRHLARFQEAGFSLSNKAQVDQVVKAVAARANLPLPVAEECVCSILKPFHSNVVFKDMAVRGEPLYSCKLNGNKEAEVWGLDCINHVTSRLVAGGFASGNRTHYRPPWSRSSCGQAESRSTKLRFSSDENLKFNVKPKSTTAQRNQMEEEEVYSMNYEVGSKEIQLLLNKNRSLVVDMEFVAKVYLLSVKDLRSAIFVESSGDGYVARFDRQVFSNSRLKGKFKKMKQLDEMQAERQPVFERLDGDDVAYQSSAHAVVALLLHLLLNINARVGRRGRFGN